jgi:hypothetical protein
MNEQPIVQQNNGVINNFRQATDTANVCREIVKARAVNIGKSRHVQVEGWSSIAVAHGCVPSIKSVEKSEDGYIAIAEIKRMDTGAVICSAEGFVGNDEPTWANRPQYAKRAMAQTRAISRACRSAFSHIVVLIDANLSTTPAEEVPYGGFESRELNTYKYEEAPKTTEVVKDIVATATKDITPQDRDMTLNFGKYKGQTIRDIAKTEKGIQYLDWLSRQELKMDSRGEPYANDIERNKIIQAILKDNPDQIPF